MAYKKSKVPWLKILAVIMSMATLGSMLYFICVFPKGEDINEVVRFVFHDNPARRFFLITTVCLGVTAYITKKCGWERFSKILAIVFLLYVALGVLSLIGNIVYFLRRAIGFKNWSYYVKKILRKCWR